MTDFSITPLATLSREELSRVGETLNALPENVRIAIAGYDSRSFLRDTLAPAYSLTEAQHRGVARFLMETVMNGTPTSEMAPELSRIAGVDANTAVQIVKEIETGLLAPLGLTLTGLAAPAAEPEVVVNEEGKEGLHYATADDLLADIADLEPADRDRFLADAKKDNRVVVLQVLSQLKLGADSGGSPLSFRELVAAEAADFGIDEWTDLARSDPDALAEPGVASHIAHTPLGAMLIGRDPTAARDIVLQFRDMDDDARSIAVGPQSAAAIQELVRGGLVPQTHEAAVGRIVFFVLNGQAAPQDVAGLLQKVGLPTPAADAAARTVATLTASVQPPAPKPAASVATRTPGLNVPNTAGRTILDLRKPRP